MIALLDPASPLDAGIAPYVQALIDAGVETFESCEGSAGHAYTEPTVRFHGDQAEGFRALAVAQAAELPIAALRRTWPILDSEPTGPWWEMTFSRRATDCDRCQNRRTVAKSEHGGDSSNGTGWFNYSMVACPECRKAAR